MTKEGLREVAENLVRLSESLMKLIEEPPPVKIEDVRTVLAEASKQGKTTEVKILLSRYGASRLSEVHPKYYAKLLSQAKEIVNA